IENFHVHQLRISKDTAVVAAEVTIEAGRRTAATVEINYAELNGAPAPVIKQTVQLDPGTNQISVPIRIANPKLWYPAGYGAQDRYRFSLGVRRGRDLAAEATLKTGLRSVELRREATKSDRSFEFVVNGVPIFAKGA